MSAVRPVPRRFTVRTAVLLLSITACGSSNDAHLFDSEPARSAAGAASVGAGGDGSEHADSGGADDAAGASGVAGASSSGGSSADSGGRANESAGASGSTTDGRSGNSGSGGAAATAGSGASAGAATLGDCTAHGSDATYFSMTQHCYLVIHELSTFAAAAAHCSALGAHLVTIANDAENAFAWSISPNEHWIGSNDGKGPKESDPGSYTWLTNEPFSYQAWSSGQPNASATECGESNGGGTCYEHCAFQWTGGEHDGQWNDRFCLHTIESVCEWENSGN